ncbi:hypothetical protein [Hasllibacter sp. MH4015]|uniref:hypothetical protein n=1 Tax=Hasllibacter sp. MH4015 TaxID=2854029 RepID=UPI002103780F|nr:hypothetical protein [Hasllibacter sp. MH4015]
MLKIVTLFLIFMAVLAMFGKLRWLGLGKIGRNKDKSPLPKPRTCPTCGRMNLRGGECRICRGGPNG